MKTKSGLEYDLLTGLYSRWYCRMALQQILDQGLNRVFGTIDIDKFSEVNQKYGSVKGDQLLQAIAQTLQETYHGSTIFRISGDEFAFILAPTTYSRYHMSMMTRQLFVNLHNIQVEGIECNRLSFSIGTVFIDPAIHKTPDEVYNDAARHRKEAKKHEGNFLSSKYGSIPDVEGAFMVLKDDRTLYNNSNNRLFSIHNEKDWLDYLHEGAELKGSMYQRNQGHLDDILNYYKNGGLPDYDYELLFQLVVNYAKSLDAFMFELLVNDILLPYYESCDRTDRKVKSRLGHLYLLMADSLISIVRMGDRSQNSRIITLLNSCREVTRDLPHDSIEFEPYFYSLCESLGHFESFDQKTNDKWSSNLLYEELRDLILGEDPFIVPNQEVYKYFESVVNNARFYPIYRACYLRLKFGSLLPHEKTEYDQRIQYIKDHIVDGVYDMAGKEPEYRHLAQYLQNIILQNLDADQILDKLILGLKRVKSLEYGTLSESNLIIVAYLFLGSSQALLLSNRDPKEKHDLAISGLNMLINILRKRESLAADPQVLFLTQVLTRSMLQTPLLTPMDKYFYLERSLASITLDTYSHSKAVSAYVKVILTNIIDNNPHLLAGPGRPYNSIEEVKVNRENLLQFMDCACMLHDVGKMNLSPISSNAYRRLTDQEFKLIRRHPYVGIETLRYEPAFEPFTPFIYAHHRWWNGQYGYPEKSNSVQKSPLQDLVYILSFCDSLEAATSHIGRNYRSAKTFLQIFDEFYVEAGTRYSKEVLESIINSPETYLAIRQMVDHNWQNIYQSIFLEIVSDDEQLIPPSDTQLPDPYQHSHEVGKVENVNSFLNNVSLPQWLREMNRDSLTLLAFSLMERNSMSVRNIKITIFMYDVISDLIGFISPSPDGDVMQTFGTHYSEHRLGMLLSEKGYNDAISYLREVINNPSYPKTGQVKLEPTDKSKCILASYTSVVDVDGKVLSIIGQLEDINTNRQRLLQTIKRQNKYIEILDSITGTYSTVVYSDINLEKYDIIKGFPILYEQSNKMSSTKQLIDFTREQLIDPEYQEAFNQFCDNSTILERFKLQKKVTFEYHSKISGWLSSYIVPATYDEQNNITHVLFVTESIDDKHNQLDRLSHAANYDSLTGLYNRLKGVEIISQNIQKGGCQIFAIMDCDRFKLINDQLSHLTGDEVLRQQGKIIRECFKGSTTMRLGGDEFIVHIYGENAYKLINSFNGVKDLFNQFCQEISHIHLTELNNIAPTMSCGVVYTDGYASKLTFEEFYKHADEALRESKKFRNGTVTISELNHRQYFQ